jgi:Protein of unknown function (DUF3007)
MGGRMHLIITVSVAIFGVTLLTGCHEAAAFLAQKPVQRQPNMQFLHHHPRSRRNDFLQRGMSVDNEGKQLGDNKLPFFLDPGTYGGVIVLSVIAFVVPILFYQFITGVLNVDGVEAGIWIGGVFTVFATLAWASTYIFRVATKDMTYVSRKEVVAANCTCHFFGPNLTAFDTSVWLFMFTG